MKQRVHQVEDLFELAVEHYVQFGVDVQQAIRALQQVKLSMHCWQGDDVRGFESEDREIGGGLAITGSYPGAARNLSELRADIQQAFSLIPGKHRLNLHAIYGDFGKNKVDRDTLSIEHFTSWIAWAKEQGIGLDFNPTFFAHPKAADGFTLAHPRDSIRKFWIEHGKRCRDIGEAIGKQLGTSCVINFWIPDGYKETPADRLLPRQRLTESLDAIFAHSIRSEHAVDALEPKLFGLGSESYVVGSHDFYLGYAITRQKLLCLDSGHYHPTESIADKISSVLLYVPQILLHLSRGVRWDSDHVVTLTDDTLLIVRELVFNNFLSRVRIGLDYFDASINRVAAWVLGMRSVLRALLIALLEPPAIRQCEQAQDYTSRLVLQEEAKALPFGAVWDYYCHLQNVPPASEWLAAINTYAARVQASRT